MKKQNLIDKLYELKVKRNIEKNKNYESQRKVEQ